MADPSRPPPPGETPTPVSSAAPAMPAAPARSAAPAGLSAVTGTGPRPEPLDPPMVPFAVAGLAAFTVAGLVLLLVRGWLADHGHTDWLWTCLAGFLIGLVGLATMMRHDAHRRRRRALTHPEFRAHAPDEPPA